MTNNQKEILELSIEEQRIRMRKVVLQLEDNIDKDPSLRDKDVSQEHLSILADVLQKMIDYKKQLGQDCSEEKKELNRLIEK
jgi:hypothetical protein